jgi:hypothetical protein
MKVLHRPTPQLRAFGIARQGSKHAQHCIFCQLSGITPISKIHLLCCVLQLKLLTIGPCLQIAEQSGIICFRIKSIRQRHNFWLLLNVYALFWTMRCSFEPLGDAVQGSVTVSAIRPICNHP